MQKQFAGKNWKNQRLYVGLDVSSVSWQVCIECDEGTVEAFVQKPESKELVRHLEDHYAGADVHAVFEAGYQGYWIYDELTGAGLTVVVAHAADVPTTDGERVRKNDRQDARKLARALRMGALNGITVPTLEERGDRGLVRRRRQAVRDRARCKTRIRSFLAFHGVTPPETAGKPWSTAYRRWLESLQCAEPSMQWELTNRLTELSWRDEQVRTATKAVEALAGLPRHAKDVALLRSVPGVGLIAAIGLKTELFRITRFPSERESASYVGLVPGERSTGKRVVMTGVTPRRNTQLRSLLIEAAWVAVRRDAALRERYDAARKRRVPAARAIVMVARTLWRRLDHVWRNGEPYRTPPPTAA